VNVRVTSDEDLWFRPYDGYDSEKSFN